MVPWRYGIVAGLGKGGRDVADLPDLEKINKLTSSFASRGAFFFQLSGRRLVLLPNMKRHVHLKKGLEVKELVLVKGNKEIIIG